MSGADPAARLRQRLAALPARLGAEVEAALLAAAADAVEAARRQLEAPAGPGPSGPGELPRDRAGAVAASLSVAAGEDGGLRLLADHPAARALEYGTRRMAPRPFLRPAVEAARPGALARCRRALARAAASLKEEP